MRKGRLVIRMGMDGQGREWREEEIGSGWKGGIENGWKGGNSRGGKGTEEQGRVKVDGERSARGPGRDGEWKGGAGREGGELSVWEDVEWSEVRRGGKGQEQRRVGKSTKEDGNLNLAVSVSMLLRMVAGMERNHQFRARNHAHTNTHTHTNKHWKCRYDQNDRSIALPVTM